MLWFVRPNKGDKSESCRDSNEESSFIHQHQPEAHNHSVRHSSDDRKVPRLKDLVQGPSARWGQRLASYVSIIISDIEGMWVGGTL